MVVISYRSHETPVGKDKWRYEGNTDTSKVKIGGTGWTYLFGLFGHENGNVNNCMFDECFPSMRSGVKRLQTNTCIDSPQRSTYASGIHHDRKSVYCFLTII